MTRLLQILALSFALAGFCSAELMIDFNSETQDGGPTNDDFGGFSPYDFPHEGGDGFSAWPTQTYPAFGTNVTLTPDWPNTYGPLSEQMIDRGANFDANWFDFDSDISNPGFPILGLDLVTDWIGVDTRTQNDGNGDWDGVVGDPTYIHLRLGDLPAGTYDWQSYHIDTEHIHGAFQVMISTDGGASFSSLPDGIMVDATEGGNPDSVTSGFLTNTIIDSQEAFDVGAVYETTFTANGTDDVVLQFAPYSEVAVHRQLFGINGFVLTEGEPGGGVTGDFNNDGDWDCEDIDALTAAIASGSTDLSFDMNGDGSVSLEDVMDAGTGWLAVGGANNSGATGGAAFLPGDANLDGVVDVPDFNVWNSFKFTSLDAWCGGDFNADGVVDVPDFNAWNANKFTSSSSPAAVPEPEFGILALLGFAALLFRGRRSR
ncbi:MAG: hypothetical protein AAF497_00455 [Planctomycetota bacterium]